MTSQRWTYLANRFLSRLITWMAALSWPLFGWLVLRDWTVVFVPLVITTGAVMHRVVMRQVYPSPPKRAVPDYAAIARMEREVYGEAFTHDGAPSSSGFVCGGPVHSYSCPARQSRRESGSSSLPAEGELVQPAVAGGEFAPRPVRLAEHLRDKQLGDVGDGLPAAAGGPGGEVRGGGDGGVHAGHAAPMWKDGGHEKAQGAGLADSPR